MTETQLLAVRLRAEAAIASARARQAAGADNLTGVQGWNECSAELMAMAHQLEASASQPASTVKRFKVTITEILEGKDAEA